MYVSNGTVIHSQCRDIYSGPKRDKINKHFKPTVGQRHKHTIIKTVEFNLRQYKYAKLLLQIPLKYELNISKQNEDLLKENNNKKILSGCFLSYGQVSLSGSTPLNVLSGPHCSWDRKKSFNAIDAVQHYLASAHIQGYFRGNFSFNIKSPYTELS